MPVREMPKFQSAPDKMFEIPQPGMGGINLFDLEFEQNVNQSPNMLNMMYRNGTFGKRYGQEISDTLEDNIYSVTVFSGKRVIHAGTNIYVDGVVALQNIPEERGIFIRFGECLYYKIGTSFYEYKETNGVYAWGVMVPYVPDVYINCQPQKDGTYDMMDSLNLLSLKFKCVYNPDGTAKDFYAYGDEENIIDWTVDPIVVVDDVTKTKGTDFTVNTTDKYIRFTTAPAHGDMSVEITFTMKSENLELDRNRLLNCKYFNAYGANGNQNLFMGGGGASKIFYSESYDATYFPENNWTLIGSTEDDVTAFGLQYNNLLVFKPREIYSIYSYMVTAAMVPTDSESEIGTEAFGATIVNSRIGCDVPHSMQLVNNQLTWMNSREGICTLVSTSISDERNVRVISRNINRTNHLGVQGLLDYTEDLNKITSVDFNEKYFIVLPENGICFMWDYAISPFLVSSSKTTDPKELDWFVFDHFYVNEFINRGQELYYTCSLSGYENIIIRLTNEFVDLDYNNDGEPDAINSYYMTPFLQFNAVEMLKNVKNVYVQCRGDTSSIIKMEYLTEESNISEKEPEDIVLGGKIWTRFSWKDFQWKQVTWAVTFRRKCNLKKVQMASFIFRNSEPESDMSIAHIGLQYQLVKYVR